MNRRSHTGDPRTWGPALGTIGGLLVFCTLVAAEHLLLAEISPRSHMVSEYSHSPAGQILNFLAFPALGLASFAATIGLRRAIAPSRSATAGATLMLIWAASWLPTAIFVTDVGLPTHTLAGVIHSISVAIGTLSFAGAILAYARVFGRDRNWRTLSLLSWGFGIATALLLGWIVTSPSMPIVGIVQRSAFALILAWLAVAAASLLSAGRHTSPGDASPKLQVSAERESYASEPQYQEPV